MNVVLSISPAASQYTGVFGLVKTPCAAGLSAGGTGATAFAAAALAWAELASVADAIPGIASRTAAAVVATSAVRWINVREVFRVLPQTGKTSTHRSFRHAFLSPRVG